MYLYETSSALEVNEVFSPRPLSYPTITQLRIPPNQTNGMGNDNQGKVNASTSVKYSEIIKMVRERNYTFNLDV